MFESFKFTVHTVRCSGHEKIDVSRSEHYEHLKGSSVELVHNPESKRFKANFFELIWNFGWSNKTFFFEILPKSDDRMCKSFCSRMNLIIQEFDRNIEI